ncbi:probable folate-biopterin transporter 9, chloroplastic isoform X1 [Telopea speciosissima]|uniref:probable folate-biopterin transporter 9, chloroplastic isoform X1 n=1 Tax=Telopea speciosissima TaxID=54955 RepID=UPI001CC404D0|nr:probable folate-biopterin transporter 9, chloroplastic isoform X1 [Telopea speciosissima]
MIYTSFSNRNRFISVTPGIQRAPSIEPLLHSNLIFNFHHQNPIRVSSSLKSSKNSIKPIIHILKPIIVTPEEVPQKNSNTKRNDRKTESPQVGHQQMLVLCGFGCWVQGFRCFPWLALNFYMAHTLNLNPSVLQLVQNSANLPMVAKPLFGVISEAVYIGGAHRIPYISIGVILQILSWGAIALVPVGGEVLPMLMPCILLSNIGASITEVAGDALVAEYSQKHKLGGLQSYAFMAIATGGILGNLLGGILLLKTQQTRTMFLLFSLLLAFQLAISLNAREASLSLPQPSRHHLTGNSISGNLWKKFSNLLTVISKESISRPLFWVIASIVVVPIFSGTIFCYQTQRLKLDPSIIGMSKVIGQLMLLSATVLYIRYWKTIPMRKLIGIVQIVYAISLLLDLVLVKQINLKLGISNDAYVLCMSGLAETIAQFKILPFSVLFTNLCPPGCEGLLTSFLASVFCLSSIISGFIGVWLASLVGISSGDYTSLPVGILLQFLAALVPLVWISFVPMSLSVRKERRRGVSKRKRRNRRAGRLIYNYVYADRHEREYEVECGEVKQSGGLKKKIE